MSVRVWLRSVRAVLGAVMLGFGTILQPKRRPDDHWSTSPRAAVVDELLGSSSGAPPEPGGLPTR